MTSKADDGVGQNRVLCVLVGHNYVHEVQVMAQVFFANSRFAFKTVDLD